MNISCVLCNRTSLKRRSAKTIALAMLFGLANGVVAETTSAQNPKESLPQNTVPLYRDDLLPGTIGAMQLQRNACLRGYMQPVEFRGPKGVEFSFANDGMFGDPVPQPGRVAMLVGVPYRIKMTGIPFQPEAELFPTIELIDRTYPPPEKAHRFPIPIEFDELEIEAAMRGEMVSRVIYLEDSSIAEPVSYVGPQRVYEASPSEDMLKTADVYGRPLAIVRLGSRVPQSADGYIEPEFLYNSPPVAPLKEVPNAEKLYDQGVFQRYKTPGKTLPPITKPGDQPQASVIPAPQTESVLEPTFGLRRIGDTY